MFVVGKSPKPTAEIRQRKFPIVFFCFFFPHKKMPVKQERSRLSSIQRDANFWLHVGRILFCEYFILASSNSVFTSLSILLPNCRLRVCTAPPPTSLPAPSARYLSPSGFDWIFSRGRNVSTKWIRRNIAFRQARSNFSFNKRESLLSLPCLFVAPFRGRSFLSLRLILFFFVPRLSAVP